MCYIIIKKSKQQHTTEEELTTMKRTKTMTYNETAESRELFLYATNNGDLYRSMTTPVITNLKKKLAKGVYDSDKAVDAYYHIATEASNRYQKDYGYAFSVADRFTVAVDMEAYYKEEIEFEFNK